MKKDEILKTAKDKFNVKLDPKEKLTDLEDKLETLEKNNAKESKPKKKKFWQGKSYCIKRGIRQSCALESYT